jgi:prepilin-type N-terminal cleavage/methylation domain-containing protein
MEPLKRISRDSRCNREDGFTLIEVLIVLAFIAIVASLVIWSSLYAFDAARLNRSLADMRTISDALQQYEVDNSGLPGGGLQPVSNLSPYLGPINPNLPDKDGWGFDIYYQDITAGGTTIFRLYSYGKIGVPDGIVTGVWTDFYTDTVNENGTFIQSKY